MTLGFVGSRAAYCSPRHRGVSFAVLLHTPLRIVPTVRLCSPYQSTQQVRLHSRATAPNSDVPMESSMKRNPSAEWWPHREQADEPTSGPGVDWIGPVVQQLEHLAHFEPPGAKFKHPVRVLVLHGTLRARGFSKLLAFECARLLDGLGLDVRVFDPAGLPVRDPEIQDHPKVVELRSLVEWSEAHVWCASELHGNLCSVFKNQIDWIPLNTGSVRPTQGKSVAILQVNGGSQSFNVVNTLRLLARWMRMPCVVNQSSVQKAWMEFDNEGRMKDSSMRMRVVDVMEEFVKFSRINREFADFLNDRYSERKEREEKGRLLTQAEKEAEKAVAEAKEKANN